MTIGEKIKVARKTAKMTQRELANLAGTATGTIQQYELGKRQPRIEQLKKIAAALNVEITDLMDVIIVDTTPDPEWATLDEKINAGSVTPEDRSRYWGIIRQTAIGAGERMSKHKIRVLDNMDKLNEEGQEKVAEYADVLVRSRKYPATSDAGDPPEGK